MNKEELGLEEARAIEFNARQKAKNDEYEASLMWYQSNLDYNNPEHAKIMDSLREHEIYLLRGHRH